MINPAVKDLSEAVQRYFDLMYDCDVTKFENVFYPTSQLHGFREGKMTMWPASEYKAVLAKRESPKSLGAARDEAILLLDVASDTQAFVKAKVRIIPRYLSTISPSTKSKEAGKSPRRVTICKVKRDGRSQN